MSSEAALGCPSGLAPPAHDARAQDPTAFVRSGETGDELDILVTGAKCGGCVAKIEAAVVGVPGVQVARMNLSTSRLHVEWRSPATALDVMEAVSGVGYQARAYSPEASTSEKGREERRLLVAMAVAGFAAANVMLLSVSVWSGAEMPAETRDMLHWLSAMIALPAALFAGRPFFGSAISALRGGNVNMDVPISLAVLLALGMSLYQTATGGHETYFDAAVMLLFFLLIGRFLDARLRRRAHGAAGALSELQTSTVSRLSVSGNLEAIRASDIQVGDRLLLSPGERLLVNGVVEEGAGNIDLRLVNGEIEPAATQVGAALFAGTINLDSAMAVRATARAGDSLLNDIARLLEVGEQRKSAYRRIADIASRIYVPVVHSAAALAFLGWFFAGAGLEKSVFTAIAVLIITCPCALALAAPVVQIVAAGRLFRDNIYLSSGDALERIAAIDHVVLDKTGTLTLGAPEIVADNIDRDVLERAAMLARTSRHPFSRAIVAEAGPGPIADEVSEVVGQGVEGLIDGAPARLGRASFVGVTVAAGGSRLWFRLGKEPAVAFEFNDRLRPAAASTIARLAKLGVTTELLSGDAPVRVAQAAGAVGIENWTAGATPVEKAERLEVLRGSGRKVLMVGDGLNDAAALAMAHASLAPGGAVDVSRLSADAVFSREDLTSLETIITVARSARSRMRENFGLSALYNLIAVPLALAGLVTPMIAAIAMSGSSLLVTLNALRLNAGKSGDRLR